jgi:hypothetical protein
VGVAIYFAYGYRHSHLGRGIVEVHEPEIHDIQPTIPGCRRGSRQRSEREPAAALRRGGSPAPFRLGQKKGALERREPFAAA